MNQLKSFLVSLVTEHLLAKFFAIVFATATVLLIEREITTPIAYVDGRVPNFVGRRPDRVDDDSAYVILQAEPGVWVDRPPSALKILVSGPKNEKATFDANPVIRLRIRQEQIPPGEGLEMRKILLDEKSFESDVKDLVVRLLEPLELTVDRVVTRSDVPVRMLPPANLPENRIFDEDRSQLRPGAVTIRGPRSVVESYGDGQRVTLVLDRSGPRAAIESGQEYPLKLSDDILQRGVTLASGASPKVVLALRTPAFEKIRLGDLPIHWSLTEEVRGALAAGELAITLDNSFVREADVVLEGPPEIVKQHEGDEKRKRLAQQIYLIADPNQDIATLGDADKVTSIRLQAIGVPTGLKASLDPATLVITLSRRDSENN